MLQIEGYPEKLRLGFIVLKLSYRRETNAPFKLQRRKGCMSPLKPSAADFFVHSSAEKKPNRFKNTSNKLI